MYSYSSSSCNDISLDKILAHFFFLHYNFMLLRFKMVTCLTSYNVFRIFNIEPDYAILNKI